MQGYLQIFGMIIIGALLTAFVDARVNKGEKKNSLFCLTLLYGTVYYFVICVLRAMAQNGHKFLGTSFIGKGVSGFIKVGVLELGTAIALLIFLKLTKEKGKQFVEYVVGLFASLWTLHTVLIDLPRMKTVIVLGIAAIIMALCLMLFEKNKFVQWMLKDNTSVKQKCLVFGSQMLFFAVVFCLAGPAELFVYNSEDFVFALSDVLLNMIVFSVVFIVVTTVLVCNFLPGKLFKVMWVLPFVYGLLGYIQSMFLNGVMNQLDGLAQTWEGQGAVVNAIIWIVAAVVIIAVIMLVKKSQNIVLGITWYISAVQMVTFLVLIFTSGMLGVREKQLIETDVLTVGKEDNVVIFILDAFDVQMMDKVMENDDTYLQPLHDFTYYNNMNSRYGATDGSLPYLLTGIVREEGDYETQEMYDMSTFFDDIMANNYDVRILTAPQYVAPFPQGYVKNYTDDYIMELDWGKMASQMTKCIRYRSVPFKLKEYYYYEPADLSNVIIQSDVYIFGTDPKFYEILTTEKVQQVEDMNKAFRIYHLYGAHTPYHLTEDVTLDFNSTPMAQWRGCLKIVYQYMDQLKEKGLYDDTTIIVMADHGLNNSHWQAMEQWNIPVTDVSKPIFFIKRAGEKHDELIIDSKAVSHDNFVPTILKSMNAENESYEKYGKAVWE